MSTKTIKMDGYVRWAKLTEEDMDTYEKHFPKSHGRLQIDFYPKDEDEIQKLWDAGAPKVSLGYDMYKGPDHPKYGGGDENLGTGAFTVLKKDNYNKHFDKDMGPPPVYDLREGDPTQRYDIENQGKIWNGSEVTVEVDVWSSGQATKVVLQKVALRALAEEPTPMDPEERNKAF
jgi:hypothetical protein